MAPPSLWSGNLRLSLVLIPVRLVPAVSTEDAISFRQIHEPSGKPIKYVKGVRDGDTFTEVPEEEIIKGYEHAKGHHVLIHPKEMDELKLEAKHTIDMVRFVDEAEIDSRYYEKPYYLVPDGDEADEGYTVIRDALKQSRKVAIGQLIMHGRQHLVGVKALGKGLALYILRYADELRDPKSYRGAQQRSLAWHSRELWNRCHPSERLARWLLMMRDRTDVVSRHAAPIRLADLVGPAREMRARTHT
jgi:DNA end-binding protein Ku